MNKDKIVAEYLPLVRSMAAKYNQQGIPQEDLEQEGMIGLLIAADKFEPDQGTKFSSYASYWIKKYIIAALEKETKTSLNSGELNEEMTRDNKAIDPPKTTKIDLPKDMPQVEKTVLSLLYEKEFTLKEIACKMNISRERVRQLKEKGLRRIRAWKK